MNRAEIYTLITSDGRTQAWIIIQGIRYALSGSLADALIEAGLAFHNPYVDVPGAEAIRNRIRNTMRVVS